MVDTGKRPIETYYWICGDPQCDTIDCLKGDDWQTVCKFWAVTGLSDFHDAELAGATKKINAILNRLEKGNRNKKRKLSFVKHQTGCSLCGRDMERSDRTMTSTSSRRLSS